MSVIRNRARIDKLLVNISRRRNVEGLIANQVLTSVFVKKDSGLIGQYDKSNLRIEHDIVGGDTPYPRVSTALKTSTRYSLEKHGLSGTLTEEDMDNEDQPFDARKDRTMELTDKIKLGREVALATPLTDTGTLTNNVTLSGTAQYNDYANSTPLEDWGVARGSIYDNSGQVVEMKGGFAIVPWPVFNKLKFHPNLLENIKHTVNMKAGLTFQQLADSMGVERILIPWGQKNDAKEGQTDNIVSIWGKNIVFGYAPRTGTKRIESLGFHIAKREDTRVFVERLRNPPNADEILVDLEYDFLLTEVGAAYLIKDAIA